MFIVITLNIPEWRLQKGVTNIVIPVLWKQKKNKTSETFNFHHVLIREAHRAMLAINKNKSISSSILSKVLRDLSNEKSISPTDCINSSISNGQFPTEIKMADAILKR